MPDDVGEFLEQLRPGGAWVLTAIAPISEAIKTVTVHTTAEADAFVRRYDGRRNVYYSVNPTRTALTKKAAKVDIAAIEYLLADLDPNDGEAADAAKTRYLAQLSAFEPEPTAIIDSGNGIQCLWKLEEPIALGEPIRNEKNAIEFSAEDRAKIEDVETRMRAVLLRLGSKAGTQNIDRIMRLPSTTNLPSRKKLKAGRVPCPTKLLRFNGATYPLTAFSHKSEQFKNYADQQQRADRDQTGSGHGFRFMQDCHADGMSHEKSREAILADDGPAGEWARRVDERQIKRAFERSRSSPEKPAAEAPPQCSLGEAHAVFRKWLGEEYDLDALDATLAAAAAERLKGDPVWLLIVGGPGAAKTETVQALSGAGAHVTSTIASEGALLSATSHRERTRTATGGLLRKIGDRGVLVIKDVTSILSADRNVRASVLAAIREIYDGRWERNVGVDGGKTLTWLGRIVIVGAVTTAWDAAHSVVAAMGDRFVLIRINSKTGRGRSGMRAIRNTGSEVQMREELAAAVGGLVTHACTDDVPVVETEIEHLVKAADIVTMARTAVERDYQGEIIDAHAPEMPTRFAKQLTQVVRGGVAIGMTREEAMRLAIRCARDSIPPLRLEILLDVALHPGSRPGDVRRRVGRPWRTTKRELEALTMLGLLRCDEENETSDDGGKDKTVWRYSLGAGFDLAALRAMAGQPNAWEAYAASAHRRQKC
jgi:hypothetical protein